MHRFIVVLLLGVAASTYGIDLSNAAAPSTRIEPRLFSFIQDLYAQVIYPPLNHVVTNLALLSAQFLAGVSQTGLPAPGGRTVHLTDAQMRGFFDTLWNDVAKPPIENALSSLSLMLAQALAGISANGINLGKRDLTEAQMRGFLDDFTNAMNQVFTNVIQKPLEQALSTTALTLAQVLAGVGVNGVNLDSLLGKRDLTEAQMRGFLDDFTNAMNQVFTNVIQKPLEQALSTTALTLAQVLAGVGVNGVNLDSLLGKRDVNDARVAELRGFFDTLGNTLLNGLQSVWTNVIQGPLENAIQTGALLGAQVLAGLGTNGVSLPGKRDLTPELRGPVIDSLVDHASGLYQEQVKPVLENAINNALLNLAGILANFSQSGIGRR